MHDPAELRLSLQLPVDLLQLLDEAGYLLLVVLAVVHQVLQFLALDAFELLVSALGQIVVFGPDLGPRALGNGYELGRLLGAEGVAAGLGLELLPDLLEILVAQLVVGLGTDPRLGYEAGLFHGGVLGNGGHVVLLDHLAVGDDLPYFLARLLPLLLLLLEHPLPLLLEHLGHLQLVRRLEYGLVQSALHLFPVALRHLFLYLHEEPVVLLQAVVVHRLQTLPEGLQGNPLGLLHGDHKGALILFFQFLMQQGALLETSDLLVAVLQKSLSLGLSLAVLGNDQPRFPPSLLFLHEPYLLEPHLKLFLNPPLSGAQVLGKLRPPPLLGQGLRFPQGHHLLMLSWGQELATDNQIRRASGYLEGPVFQQSDEFALYFGQV